MGEYARIKKTNEVTKIGTCASMYYLIYEDANLVDYFDNPTTKVFNEKKTRGLLFRVPFPDELDTPLGEYGAGAYNRGHPLLNFPIGFQ